ncbi:hypothetical protein GCM10011352_24040 [Marinobacterium zhoushanense]|uniref:Fibronectin type-III domain-containing protein n=1 Tax=Marinobacterium zhoushanense TaxID=1679163 RepID=A0ABQ1KF20_9GAMM|nr:hypothetical protein [Marinobacterium zhoushanense]GGB97087.1 hypothetical protein GCM10011352_24040 [Marinobacterium zhoushanense]
MKKLIHTQLQRRLTSLALLLIGCCALLSNAAQAAVTSATGSSATSVLVANKNNNFTIRWQVTTTTNRFSREASVINLASPLTLNGVITPAGDITNESFSISGAQVKSWIDAGLSTIIIRRNFTDLSSAPAGGINADVRFSLSSSGLRATRESGAFAVQRLQLSFSNQTSLAVVEPGQELFGYLDVDFSGTGILEGYWQLSEPGGSDAAPLFRTLKLERQTLSSLQHLRLPSPRLPTGKTGKYLLRFCVIDRNTTDGNAFNCPDEGKVVTVAYQVLAAPLGQIEEMQLSADTQPIGPATPLHWSPVEHAVVYQLQIFQAAGNNAPTFVAGMLLPSSTPGTSLSTLVLDKLNPHQQYLWRINALDSQGRVIGQSEMTAMTYVP